MTVADQVAADLLEINAVFLRPSDPFTWASGIRSPIYCDNRLILSVPTVRGRVEDRLAAMIRDQFPDAQVLMGTATAGIAHAALVAERLDLPMGYVRGGAKGHGRGNQIEGRLDAGAKVVVVEDLISTGGSSLEAVQTLRDAGADVLGIAALFTYNMERAAQRLEAENVPCHVLSNLDALVEVAVPAGYITAEEGESVLRFRDNPPAWEQSN